MFEIDWCWPAENTGNREQRLYESTDWVSRRGFCILERYEKETGLCLEVTEWDEAFWDEMWVWVA